MLSHSAFSPTVRPFDRPIAHVRLFLFAALGSEEWSTTDGSKERVYGCNKSDGSPRRGPQKMVTLRSQEAISSGCLPRRRLKTLIERWQAFGVTRSYIKYTLRW